MVFVKEGPFEKVGKGEEVDPPQKQLVGDKAQDNACDTSERGVQEGLQAKWKVARFGQRLKVFWVK